MTDSSRLSLATLIAAVALLGPQLARAQASAQAGWAILEVVQVVEECSNAGGTHVVLRVVDSSVPGVSLVHFGGHALYPFGQPGSGARGLGAGHLFVGEVVRGARIREDQDGHPDTLNAGWCLSDLMRTDGFAGALRPVSSLARGRRLMSRLRRTPHPAWRPESGRPPSCAVERHGCANEWQARVVREPPAGAGHQSRPR